MIPPKHTGRRPGPTTTRGAIEDIARKHFAERGYDRTSMRQVAIEARVDPGLVTHYFGAKIDLFLAVVEPPVDRAALIDHVVGGPPDHVGLRLASAVLDVLEDDVRRRPILGMIRAATAEPAGARLVRDYLTRNVVLPIARRLDSDEPEYRAGLVMSQIVGLALARYIVGIEPLASQPRERVAADLAPTLQRYLLGALTA